MSKNTKRDTSSPETKTPDSPSQRPESPWRHRFDSIASHDSRSSSFDLAAPKVIGSIVNFYVGSNSSNIVDQFRLLLDNDKQRSDNLTVTITSSAFNVNHFAIRNSGDSAAAAASDTSSEDEVHVAYFTGLSDFLSKERDVFLGAASFRRELEKGAQVAVLNIDLRVEDKENHPKLFEKALKDWEEIFCRHIVIVGDESAPDSLKPDAQSGPDSSRSEKYRVGTVRFNFILNDPENFQISELLNSSMEKKGPIENFVDYAKSILDKDKTSKENFCTKAGQQSNKETAERAQLALFRAVEASKAICDLSPSNSTCPRRGRSLVREQNVTQERSRSINLGRMASAARSFWDRIKIRRSASVDRGKSQGVKASKTAGPQDLRRPGR